MLNKTRDACLEKVEQTYRIAKEALAHTIQGSGLANASCNEWEGGAHTTLLEQSLIHYLTPGFTILLNALHFLPFPCL